MSDDASFIQAIRKDPEDTACRLIYADWLDERNDPRGEYLRLGCRQAEINARLALLRQQLDPEWLAAVRPFKHTDVLLKSGRTIYLRELRQFQPYEEHEVLPGCIPTSEMNQRLLDQCLEAERGKGFSEPYLIRPTETPLTFRDPPPLRLGQPAALPAVGCIGRFVSYDPARNTNHNLSGLIVIWFQEQFALPIDPEVLEQLRKINWEQHASDFDY